MWRGRLSLDGAGAGDTEKTECPEDVLEKSVGSDIEHFEAITVSPTSLAPHYTLKFGKSEERSCSMHPRSGSTSSLPGIRLPLLRLSTIVAVRGSCCRVERTALTHCVQRYCSSYLRTSNPTPLTFLTLELVQSPCCHSRKSQGRMLNPTRQTSFAPGVGSTDPPIEDILWSSAVRKRFQENRV